MLTSFSTVGHELAPTCTTRPYHSSNDYSCHLFATLAVSSTAPPSCARMTIGCRPRLSVTLRSPCSSTTTRIWSLASTAARTHLAPRSCRSPSVRDRSRRTALTWAFLGLDGEVTGVRRRAAGRSCRGSSRDRMTPVSSSTCAESGAVVSADGRGDAAYARAMIAWHRRHRFCSVCGTATESQRAGHVRRCRNPDVSARVLSAYRPGGDHARAPPRDAPSDRHAVSSAVTAAFRAARTRCSRDSSSRARASRTQSRGRCGRRRACRSAT